MIDVALTRLADDPLLVGLDFDGVLAEIVARPEDAVPVDGVGVVLEALVASPATRVAAVSGRRRDDLADRLRPPHGVILVGEHGADFGRPGQRPAAHGAVHRLLQEIADRFPGAWVEEKHTGLTLHGRALDEADAETMADEAMGLLEPVAPGLFERGNRVVDVRLTGATKGEAIAAIRHDSERVLYVGDDTTDETVFVTLGPGDVGVKVGPGPTAASLRLPDPTAVVAFLRNLVVARAG